MRDTFIFYRSFYEAIKDLPDKDQLLIFQAISEYSLNHKEIGLTGISKTVFILIKPNLEANYQRFVNGSKPKSKQPRSETEAKPKQTRSKREANKDKDKDVNKDNNVNVNKKKESGLVFPFNTNHFIEYWNVWKKYKKEQHNFTYKSVISEQAALKKLYELSYNNEIQACSIIENSIAQGYKGLFKLNSNETKKEQLSDLYTTIREQHPDL